jgi:hypothetical protein
MALFILTILFIFGLFASEYLLILSAQVKYNNQYFAVANSRNLIGYFNTSSQLNIFLIYSDLRDNYNYSNPWANV